MLQFPPGGSAYSGRGGAQQLSPITPGEGKSKSQERVKTLRNHGPGSAEMCGELMYNASTSAER